MKNFRRNRFRSKIAAKISRRHDRDQQQRRREEHRPGRLAVGTLEAHIIDHIRQVHEAAIGMNIGKHRIERQCGRRFLHPHQHQRRHLARPAGHRQDHARQNARQGPRQDDPANRLPFAPAAGIRALAHRIGHGGQRLFGGHDHDRGGEQGERERGPQQAPFVERRIVVHQAGSEKAVEKGRLGHEHHGQRERRHPQRDATRRQTPYAAARRASAALRSARDAHQKRRDPYQGRLPPRRRTKSPAARDSPARRRYNAPSP